MRNFFNELKIDAIHRHLDLVATLRDRNENWANAMENTEIADLHVEISSLCVQVMATYNRLLDKYQQPPNVENGVTND